METVQQTAAGKGRAGRRAADSSGEKAEQEGRQHDIPRGVP